MSVERSRTGVWSAGGRGSVATTVIAGTAAPRARLAGASGCVTEQPGFPDAGLPAVSDLALFFKDPVGTGEHAVMSQYAMPRGFAAGLGDGR